MNKQTAKIISITKNWIGTPYRHQASTLYAGCDCLGLLRGVWREMFGNEPMKIPPYQANWRDKTNASALQKAAENFLLKTSNKPQAGDMVLFQMLSKLPPKHCAIMITDDMFVHAQEQIGVVAAPLSEAWKKHLHSTYKFPKIKQK